MDSKEKKFNIEVNIGGIWLSMTTSLSKQDAVRETESEIAVLLKRYRASFPNKTLPELLAMVAYEFASGYIALKKQIGQDTAEAEDLLEDISRLSGKRTLNSDISGVEPYEFDVF